ncbi:MAG: glycosyltransferase, partial [Planctomycetes bacterium]|nr:glycosyltransferase [Planctomycetota bacterium]
MGFRACFAIGLLLLAALLLAAVALPTPWSWLIGGCWIAYDTWLVLHHLRRGCRAITRDATCPTAGVAPISVLVAAHNEVSVICDCLDRLELQAGDEALVLDDGSTDGTADAVVQIFALHWSDGPVRRASRPGCPVTVLALPRGGKARALNQGLALARGEVVLTFDAENGRYAAAVHADGTLAGKPGL